MQPIDNPPPYDAGSNGTSPSPHIVLAKLIPTTDTKQKPLVDVKAPLTPQDQPKSTSTEVITTTVAGPSSLPAMPPTTVYYYHNPMTSERMTSLLPPNHPEMVCMQQGHVLHTRFGILGEHCLLPNSELLLTCSLVGVMAAVFWFPLGIALCMVDRRSKCDRCGHVAADGIQCG